MITYLTSQVRYLCTVSPNTLEFARVQIDKRMIGGLLNSAANFLNIEYIYTAMAALTDYNIDAERHPRPFHIFPTKVHVQNAPRMTIYEPQR